MSRHSCMDYICRIETNQNPEKKKGTLFKRQLTEEEKLNQVKNRNSGNKMPDRRESGLTSQKDSENSIKKWRVRFTVKDRIQMAKIPPGRNLISPWTLNRKSVKPQEYREGKSTENNDHSLGGVAFKVLTHLIF